ncbi:MAG: beta-N-acetylhexosaminidase [Desulfobaccales bacterium]|jgi:beta-N-acetylhexosaminidase
MTLSEVDRQTNPWGRFFMVGIPGPGVDAVAREMVQDLKVGGIILFSRNLETPQQIWHLTHELQRLAREAGQPPLLISTDQEGGPVQRLKDPFTLIPAARQLGVAATPEEVGDMSRRVARELALVGINMNLAPVLDVPLEPGCPLWDRSYSQDPRQVARFGRAAIEGYLAGGVLPVAKHFPGLGDTLADSHLDLTVAQSGDSSREKDLLPYREAVAAGAPAVMTAHLLVPQWDDLPATLSAVALRGWLRQRLGFKGVIITDDLEMKGITQLLPPAQAGRKALLAGADLLLICNNREAVWDAVRVLEEARDPAESFRESAARLERLRQALPPQQPGLKELKEYFGFS